MNRTLLVSIVLSAVTTFTSAGATEQAAAVAVPNASQNGTLISVPICKEISQWPYNIPPNFQIMRSNGTPCDGYSCYSDYGLFPTSVGAHTVTFDQDATVFGVSGETCLCGVFQSCAASQNPSWVSILPGQTPTPVLVQITGEVSNITDSSVQAQVQYRAYRRGGAAAVPLTLAIQVLQGYGWVDVATRSLDYDVSYYGNQFRVAELSATVPANSQIRAEVRWPVAASSPYLPAYNFNLFGASLFGAQCFPSPDPNTVMCQ
jgi:hypothetical protein